jgi:transcriptional regulator with XRE-family HTH domain
MNVTGDSIVVTGPMAPITTWTADLDGNQVAAVNEVPLGVSPSNQSAPDRPLHRLCDVRRGEGLTRRQVARRLGVSVHEVQRQEQPSSDMLLSDLHRWQEALAVPMIELLQEPNGELSPPVQLRARLVLIMKTVRSIQLRARQASLRRLIETLVDQLVEIMPELKDSAPWPEFGRRRRQHELGQAFFRRISFDPLDDLEGPES